MYFVYILKCSDRTFYTGITNNLEKRIEEHNSSRLGAKYTRGRRPVRLVYSQKFKNKSSAAKEECRIKKLSRINKIKLIKKNMNGQNRSDIIPGLLVSIVQKQDQRTGALTGGIVQDILTNSPTHPHGIKVRLETGEVGRVQEIHK